MALLAWEVGTDKKKKKDWSYFKMKQEREGIWKGKVLRIHKGVCRGVGGHFVGHWSEKGWDEKKQRERKTPEFSAALNKKGGEHRRIKGGDIKTRLAGNLGKGKECRGSGKVN